MEAFCSQACANAWITYEAPVRPKRAEFGFETTQLVGAPAPPREACRRFGGSLKQEAFRTASGASVRASLSFRLGAVTSELLEMEFWRGESRAPFATCRPDTSKVCWWDGTAFAGKPVRAALLYAPAKTLFLKARYRFHESTDADFERRARDERFGEFGTFCSESCRKAWALHSLPRAPWMTPACLQLDEVRDTLRDIPSVTPRPPREALREFGGFLSLQNFRSPAMANFVGTTHPVALPNGKLGFEVELSGVSS
jgi:hypothetical protein